MRPLRKFRTLAGNTFILSRKHWWNAGVKKANILWWHSPIRVGRRVRLIGPPMHAGQTCLDVETSRVVEILA